MVPIKIFDIMQRIKIYFEIVLTNVFIFVCLFVCLPVACSLNTMFVAADNISKIAYVLGLCGSRSFDIDQPKKII